MQQIVDTANQFVSWVKDKALPLWAGAGFNQDVGVSYERLLANGEPDLQANSRVLVQARQIYVFARAYELGWYPEGLALVQRMLEFLEHTARHPVAEQGYVHLLDKEYQIIDPKQDLYDHAFHILANIRCYKAFGMQECYQRAEAIFDYLNRTYASEYGGWLEGDYSYVFRRQNPHMHLFEAFLTFYEATHNDKWLNNAEIVYRLFLDHFYDHQNNVLYEYFNDDWTLADSEPGRIVEPGHMLEWVWLLRWYQKLSGDDVSDYANALYKKALAIGLCPQTGLLFDEVSASGNVIKASKRCWPMTEYIKAGVAQSAAGDSAAIMHAVQATENIIRYYISPALTDGAYIDQLDANNGILRNITPASTMYHLIVAASELSYYMKSIR